MGGGAPDPPDPRETASAQMSANIGTAVAGQRGSMVNTIDPLSTTTFEQTGTFEWKDPLEPKADPYQIPTYTRTTKYTPIGQDIVDQNNQTMLNLAGLGSSQSAKLNELLSRPIDMSNDAVEGRIIELQKSRMDPHFAEQKEAFETQMAQRGILPGSTLYDRERRNFEENKNDAYNNMFLSGRGQALNELLTERNQPLNEIAALLSGSQVQQPQFQATPTFNPATVDYAGISNANYQQQLAADQAEAFPIGGLFSGLGALGGAALGNPAFFA